MLKLRKIQHLQDVQQLKEEKEMNITYHEENGYLIPNVVVGGDAARPIGKYGRMRNRYLQEYHPVLFEIMVMNGTLFYHLIETEEAVQTRLEVMIPALATEAGATEALKAADQMKWIGIMNCCKARAEEIIFHEIIYV